MFNNTEWADLVCCGRTAETLARDFVMSVSRFSYGCTQEDANSFAYRRFNCQEDADSCGKSSNDNGVILAAGASLRPSPRLSAAALCRSILLLLLPLLLLMPDSHRCRVLSCPVSGVN